MPSLDELFEEVAENNRKQAEKDDNDKALQERIKAKKAADIEKYKRMGVMDSEGNWIESEEPEDQEEYEEDGKYEEEE